MTNTSQKFWPFSLAIYAKPSVAETCLTLQNSYALDVNLVLFCCWYGSTRGSLPSGVLDAAYLHSEKWRQQVVQPLRNARTWMKNTGPAEMRESEEFNTLRQQIKTVELSAEKMQQFALERLAQGDSAEGQIRESGPAIQHNVAKLLDRVGLARSAELEKLLNVLAEHSTQAKD